MTKIARKTHGAGPKHGGFFPGDVYAMDLHAQTPPPLFLFLLCHAWPGHIGTEAVTKRDYEKGFSCVLGTQSHLIKVRGKS